MLQLRFPHSLQTMDFTLVSAFAFLQIRSTLRQRHVPTLYTMSGLRIVGDQYKDQANRHHLAAPTFAAEDMVWLLRRHIATTHPCAKLDYKKLGPFCIIERINQVTFWLALPPTPG